MRNGPQLSRSSFPQECRTKSLPSASISLVRDVRSDDQLRTLSSSRWCRVIAHVPARRITTIMMVTPAKAKNRASALLSLNRSARAIRSHRFSANQIVPRPRRLSYRLMTRARFLDPLPLTSITPLCHLKVITEFICMPMPCDRVPRRAHFLWNFARVKTSVCYLSDASVTHAGSTIDSA